MLKRLLTLILLLLPAWAATAKESCPAGAPQLIIYHAGSLSSAFKSMEDLFTQQTGVCIVDAAGGSVSLARRITAGGLPSEEMSGRLAETIEFRQRVLFL